MSTALLATKLYVPPLRAYLVLTFILERRIMEGYDLEALLRQVTCPALFVQGDAAFGGLEDHVAERAADLLPRDQRLKIQGAGHNVHQTHPEAVLQAAVQFLEPA
jgi:pimeloyl-ACP methyl ester carboxylesterase